MAATYRSIGEPGRHSRSMPTGVPSWQARPDAHSMTYQAWSMHGRESSIGAVLTDRGLWLYHSPIGGACYRVRAGRIERLPLTTERPPWASDAQWQALLWTLVDSQPGDIWLLYAGDYFSELGYLAHDALDGLPGFVASDHPYGRQDELLLAREQLADLVMAGAPGPRPRILERFRTPRSPRAGALLSLSAGFEPDVTFVDFRSWLQGLDDRGLELSWRGTEGGPSLIDTFDRDIDLGIGYESWSAVASGADEREPTPEQAALVQILLTMARDHHYITEDMVESVEAWLSDSDWERPPPARPMAELVPGDSLRGWWRPVTAAEFAEDIVAHGGEAGVVGHWHWRWTRSVPGSVVIERLRAEARTVAIIGLFSSPDEDDAVYGWYLLGAIDRLTGRLRGVLVQRIFT